MPQLTPQGFRDVLPKEARERERIVDQFRASLDERQYDPITTSTFELSTQLEKSDLDLNYTFRMFDDNGDILVARPDATLSVARSVAHRLSDCDLPLRLRYDTNVFRKSAVNYSSPRSLKQLGAEVIGISGSKVDSEIILDACYALQQIGLKNFTVSLGSVKLINSLLELDGISQEFKEKYLLGFHASNFVDVKKLVQNSSIEDENLKEALIKLPRLVGGYQVLEELDKLCDKLPLDTKFLDELRVVWEELEQSDLSKNITFDFSILDSFDYYTGIVFDIYAQGLSQPIGSGGRYDNLLESYGMQAPAMGFAFSLESLQTALTKQARYKEKANKRSAQKLRIAISKGTLFDDCVALLEKAGLPVQKLKNPGRSLIINEGNYEYVIVRPTDAPTFVAFGGADCGICGRDSLIEAGVDVSELVDLQFGSCRFIEAEPQDSNGSAKENYARLGFLKVATKYPKIAKAYYDTKGIQVEIVELRGNVELGPIVGMTDRVIDITETGRTLRENNLVITGEVLPSSARFFANQASLRTKPAIQQLTRKLEEAVNSDK